MAFYCVGFVAAIAVSCVVTWYIRNLANHYGLACGSISSHHIHARPISRLGGLAVFLTFFGIFSFYLIASRFAPGSGHILKLLLPASWLFVIGLIDDLRGLSAKTKLLAQIVAGLWIYASGLRLFDSSLPHSAPWVGAASSLVATVFWVVLISNAINLIDGLDGLATGVALLSMVSILTFALVGGMRDIAVTTLILGGTLLGFLVFNFCPASIFLGDSGSLFVGFMLSGLVLELCGRQKNVLDSVMMPVFCLTLPLAETTISVLRRFIGGRSLFEADRQHIHHKLLNLGLTQRQAVWTLYAVCAVCTVLGFVLFYPSRLLLIPAGAIVVLLLFFFVRKLGYSEFTHFGRSWRLPKEVPVRNIAAQRAFADPQNEVDADWILEGQVFETCVMDRSSAFVAKTSEQQTPR
jgi:UDP-GlcNAc:undecaprenyl-phosphate/decaprenyl-phosphate GlcNAc-1-phosphate transferase